MTIRAVFPIFNNGQGVTYTCRSLCEHMGDESVGVEAWFPSSDRSARSGIVRNAYSRSLMPIIYRLPNANRRLAAAAERSLVRSLKSGDIAYLWPGVTLDTYRRIKDRGITIVTERINCHTQFAKELLDAEYDRIGWPASHGLDAAGVEREHKECELADLVFAPNRFVVRSLLDCGVPQEKILPVSYGWDPQRMAGTSQAVPLGEGLTILCVGRLCIRKGVHLLLDAWQKAQVPGTLLFAGAVHHDVAERLENELSRPNVKRVGHTLDVGAIYRSGDVFVVPALEEGGPLVTYEAMGCGLPVIASPMGSGPARDGVDGFIVAPHDIDGWVDAIRQMYADTEMRKRMGRAASQRAASFTWQKVGAQRRKALTAALAGQLVAAN